MIEKKLISTILLCTIMFMSLGASAAATNEFNNTQISKSASNVNLFVDTYHRLPNTVGVYNTDGVKQTVGTQQFLYLLTKSTLNINRSISTDITLKTVSKPASGSESLKSGSLSKSEYAMVASSVTYYITKNGKAPSTAKTSLGTMRYENLVYTFSKILNFYGVNDRLPGLASVQTWSSISSTKTPSPITVIDTSKAKVVKTWKDTTGYVQKIGPYGNANSPNKVAIIVGVHPQEGSAHLSMTNALKAYSSSLKNVQIWLFKVYVNTNYISDYSLSRTIGQNLAYKFVVPNIDTSYKLVVDTHGNRGNYKVNGNQLMSDFVFAPNKDTAPVTYAAAVTYANQIIGKTTFLKYYYVAGSSPKYVTIPLAEKGIPSLVYELYMNVYNYPTALYKKSVQVVKAINSVFA